MTEAVVHVVDDDESARESLAFLLESADFEVTTYPGAPEFLAALPTAKPGCVITDVRMPGDDGLVLLDKLKAAHKALEMASVWGGPAGLKSLLPALKQNAGFLEKLVLDRPAVELEDRYRAVLRDNRPRDAAAGRTLDGPHLTDLAVVYPPKAIPAAAGAPLSAELLKLLRAGDMKGAKKMLEQSNLLEARVIRAALDWTEGGAEAVSQAVEAELGKLRRETDKGSTLLGTIGNNAPFVGLLGTVWGIMNSFVGIAKSQSTNLAVVAPGIAEALFATAIGLVAAIPAVLAYNQISTALARFAGRLEAFGAEFGAILSRQSEERP